MKIEKKTITPSEAKSMLEKNTNNRNCSERTVAIYANSIKKGLWKEDTFELIKISKSGRILDGQHRLKAIIKANIPINLHIAYELNDDIFDVLDTGKKRNPSDVFKINNVKNGNSLPSMIQLYFSLKNNHSIRSTGLTKTNTELLSTYEENSIFWDMVATKSLTWYHNFSKILPPQYVGGFYAFFYEIDSENANKFMDDLANGTTENKSILVLRKRLVDDKVSLRKISSEIKFALIIKTWNFFRLNKTVSCLKFDPTKEPFPTAI